MKNNIAKRTIFVYFLTFLVFSLVFVFSFRTPLFQNQKVLFYRGVSLLAVCTILTFLFEIFVFYQKRKSSLETLISALVLSFSIHLAFFIVFPVTFDRSVTIFLLDFLNKNQKQEECLKKEFLEGNFINKYVIKDGAIERRIQEQSVTGFIDTKNGCLFLTNAGVNFLKFSSLIKKIYNLK